MTMKSKLVSFFAAGMLVSSVGAYAEGATIPDPDLAPSTESAEATLPPSPPNSPELATIPDFNLGPSTEAAEANLPPSPANSPELATVPDPNLAPSDAGEMGTHSAASTESEAIQ